MESNRSKNTGSASSGYQAVIELPECWKREIREARPVFQPTMKELVKDGWITASMLASALNKHRTSAGHILRRGVIEGRYEQASFVPADKGKVMRFFRPKTPTP